MKMEIQKNKTKKLDFCFRGKNGKRFKFIDTKMYAAIIITKT